MQAAVCMVHGAWCMAGGGGQRSQAGGDGMSLASASLSSSSAKQPWAAAPNNGSPLLCTHGLGICMHGWSMAVRRAQRTGGSRLGVPHGTSQVKEGVCCSGFSVEALKEESNQEDHVHTSNHVASIHGAGPRQGHRLIHATSMAPWTLRDPVARHRWGLLPLSGGCLHPEKEKMWT